MLLKTQAAREVAQFLAHHPTPEQIIAFHPSPEVAARAYDLIQNDREGSLTERERQDLESYAVIEYLMELVKLEAHRQLWHRHFHLNSARIEGITASGRATAAILHLND